MKVSPCARWSWLSPSSWRCPPRRPRRVGLGEEPTRTASRRSRRATTRSLSRSSSRQGSTSARRSNRGRARFFRRWTIAPFIPDYYLGVIYARQGRHKQAQEYLERALRDELVKQEDRTNYALATSSLQRARDEQTRVASNITAELPAGVPPSRRPRRPQPPPATTDRHADQPDHTDAVEHHG